MLGIFALILTIGAIIDISDKKKRLKKELCRNLIAPRADVEQAAPCYKCKHIIRIVDGRTLESGYMVTERVYNDFGIKRSEKEVFYKEKPIIVCPACDVKGIDRIIYNEVGIIDRRIKIIPTQFVDVDEKGKEIKK